MGSRITLANVVHTGGRKLALPPLGILHLAGVLEPLGYDVDILDLQQRELTDPFSVENVLSLLKRSAPILGIGCFAQYLPQVVLALRELKRQEPDRRVVLGGPGPAGVARGLLRHFPEIDAVALGESETVVAPLMQALGNGGVPHGVPGVAYRLGPEIVCHPPAPRIREIDLLPPPAYHLVDLEAYDSVYLVTSRGCMHGCAFCNVPSFWGPVRHRRLERVIDELASVVAAGKFGGFLVADDNFACHRARVLEFCRLLRESGLGLEWWCYARIDSMDEELLEAMAEAGCQLIEFGIESGSDRVLQRVGKGFSISRAEEVVRRSLRYVSVQISYIWGYPFETLEDFDLTLSSLSRLLQAADHGNEVLPYLFRLSPMPGTPLFRRYGESIEPVSEAFPFGQCALEDFELLRPVPVPEEVLCLIREHRHVFAPLCVYDTPDRRQKEERLRSLRDDAIRLVGKAMADRSFASTLRRSPRQALAQFASDPGVGALLAATEVSRTLRSQERDLSLPVGPKGDASGSESVPDPRGYEANERRSGSP